MIFAVFIIILQDQEKEREFIKPSHGREQIELGIHTASGFITYHYAILLVHLLRK